MRRLCDNGLTHCSILSVSTLSYHGDAVLPQPNACLPLVRPTLWSAVELPMPSRPEGRLWPALFQSVRPAFRLIVLLVVANNQRVVARLCGGPAHQTIERDKRSELSD